MSQYLTLSCPTCGNQKEIMRFKGAHPLYCCHAYVAVVDGDDSESLLLRDCKVTYRKVVITHVKPPIPTHEYDWSAHLDGDEEDGPKGWGVNRRDAMLDLVVEVETQMEG